MFCNMAEYERYGSGNEATVAIPVHTACHLHAMQLFPCAGLTAPRTDDFSSGNLRSRCPGQAKLEIQQDPCLLHCTGLDLLCKPYIPPFGYLQAQMQAVLHKPVTATTWTDGAWHGRSLLENGLVSYFVHRAHGRPATCKGITT